MTRDTRTDTTEIDDSPQARAAAESYGTTILWRVEYHALDLPDRYVRRDPSFPDDLLDLERSLSRKATTPGHEQRSPYDGRTVRRIVAVEVPA